MLAMSELTDLILGTAGHIDHGKTSLIRMLTGTETDRLPEEKKRGITIEPGYASLELDEFRLGIVDVPGHEKFIRQMLSAATGMDLALLVVAGDDSVKPQTREHLDILRMLDLAGGVIAMTRCDLCDDDWLDLVEEEIRGLVLGTFLEHAPIIRTSAHDGSGADELKAALAEVARPAAERRAGAGVGAPFRMAIDRVFPIEGHGTVVTGSVSSGSVNVGDTLQLQPGSVDVRVRGIENHDHQSSSALRGQRAAINLAGVRYQEVQRGHELGSIGHLQPASVITVSLHLLAGLKKPLADRSKIRVHVGTKEASGVIRLMDTPRLEPGKDGLAQIYLTEDVVTVWNQPFVIRLETPVVTLGGGRILHPSPAALKQPTDRQLQHMAAMRSDRTADRVASAIYLSPVGAATNADWSRIAGAEDIDSVSTELYESGALLDLKISQTRSLTLHADQLTEVADKVVHKLAQMHELHPLRFSHPLNELAVSFAWLQPTELLAAAIDSLKTAKKIVANKNTVSLVGRGPKLSTNQRKLYDELVAKIAASRFQPPTVTELEKATVKNRDSVAELMQLAVENGQMVSIGHGIYVDSEVLANAKREIADAMAKGDGLTMSELRQLLDTTRKYAVPICEYLDDSGFTVRENDVRRLSSTP